MGNLYRSLRGCDGIFLGGRGNRLDRETLHQGVEEGVGSDAYAQEESRAGMTTMTVNGVMRLPHDAVRHASNEDSWLKELNDDPGELRRAARDASAACEQLLQCDYERPRTVRDSACFGISLLI